MDKPTPKQGWALKPNEVIERLNATAAQRAAERAAAQAKFDTLKDTLAVCDHAGAVFGPKGDTAHTEAVKAGEALADANAIKAKENAIGGMDANAAAVAAKTMGQFHASKVATQTMRVISKEQTEGGSK